MSTPLGEPDPHSLKRLLAYTNWGRGPSVKRRREAPPIGDDSPGRLESPRRRRALAELAGAMATLYAGPKLWKAATREKIEFFTSFDESDPLRAWRHFQGGSLRLERVAERVTARPQGLSLLRPSQNLTDGVAVFQMAVGRTPARIVVRGADDRNGYVVGLLRNTPMELTLLVHRLRKGIILPKPLTGNVISYSPAVMLSAPWLRLKMDGKYFTAWLEWEEPRANSKLSLLMPPIRQRAVIHNWKDRDLGYGAVGLMGPGHLADARQPFRVYTVEVNNQREEAG